MPRKYQKVSECPPLLEKMIELVNLLPTDAQQLFDKICKRRVRVRNDNGVIIQDTAKEILNEKIVEYCFDREPVYESLERFNDLIKAKNLFRHFVELNKKFPAWKEAQKDKVERYKFNLNFFTVDYQNREFSVLLSFNSEGFIKLRRSDFLDMFEDSDIPIYRIRECKVCLNIFWAKKTNSITCGKQSCIDGLQNEKKKTAKEKLNNHFQSRVKK
jgi:hypothetical protein